MLPRVLSLSGTNTKSKTRVNTFYKFQSLLSEQIAERQQLFLLITSFLQKNLKGYQRFPNSSLLYSNEYNYTSILLRRDHIRISESPHHL